MTVRMRCGLLSVERSAASFVFFSVFSLSLLLLPLVVLRRDFVVLPPLVISPMWSCGLPSSSCLSPPLSSGCFVRTECRVPSSTGKKTFFMSDPSGVRGFASLNRF